MSNLILNTLISRYTYVPWISRQELTCPSDLKMNEFFLNCITLGLIIPNCFRRSETIKQVIWPKLQLWILASLPPAYEMNWTELQRCSLYGETPSSALLLDHVCLGNQSQHSIALTSLNCCQSCIGWKTISHSTQCCQWRKKFSIKYCSY